MAAYRCAAFFGALVLMASSVHAQQDTAEIELAPVTVTVTRMPLRIVDAPLAITVIDKETFAHANGMRIDEALRSVPGVLAQSRYGGSDVRIVIRGFGARGAGDRSNAGTTRGVRILQDGFPETEPDGRTALDLVDLAAIERVEVVRSNASSLWGNAAGGLVNFSSLPQRTDNPIELQYQFGGFGLSRMIAQGRSLLDNGMFYGTFTHTSTDGYRANAQGQRTLGNAGFIATVGEGSELRIHAAAADNQLNIPGPLTLAQLRADPSQANATYAQRHERRHNLLGRLGVQLEHNLGGDRSVGGMVYVNPKYLRRSERGTFRDFTRYHVGGNATFRVGRFLAGVDEAYQDGAALFYGLTADGERDALDLRDNKREGANNLGAYVQHTLTFMSVDFTLGARYDNIRYDYEDNINPRLSDTKSFARVTPKLSALYHISADHSVYANVGGGIEAPAGNETDPAGTFGADTIFGINPLLDAIRSKTYEVGTKQVRTFSGSALRLLSYDVAIYQTNVENEIVPYRGGRFYFTAARAVRRGAEFGISASTSPGITLRTALTFSDNRYRDYVVDSVHYSPAKAGHFADYSDNKVVGVPDRFGSFEISYEPAFLPKIAAGVEMESVASYFADDANTTEVPGYTLIGASVRSRRPVRLGRLELTGILRGENLADKRYVSSSFLNPDIVGGEAVAFEPGLPRHFVLSLSLGWTRPD